MVNKQCDSYKKLSTKLYFNQNIDGKVEEHQIIDKEMYFNKQLSIHDMPGHSLLHTYAEMELTVCLLTKRDKHNAS